MKQALKTMLLNRLSWLRAVSLFVVFGLSLLGCASNPGKTDQADNLPKVLIVNTNSSIDRYLTVQSNYLGTIEDVSIELVDLQNDEEPIETLQDEFNQRDYDAVFAIGAKALGALDYLDQDVPVVFSSVLNWRRFQAQSNIYGVASEISPKAQLTWFKHFFPKVETIGLVYSRENKQLVVEAEQYAQTLGLKLVTERVTSEEDALVKVERLLDKSQALWLLPDPLVLASTKGTKALFDLAKKHQKPVFAYNELFMEYGATLSLSADVATTGRQAALVTMRLLKHRIKGSSVQFPAGSDISLNLDLVDRYQLDLNEDALDSVSKILVDFEDTTEK